MQVDFPFYLFLVFLSYDNTFCYLGARNSFTARPISVYVKGETQNPHLSHCGMEAAKGFINQHFTKSIQTISFELNFLYIFPIFVSLGD